MKWEINHTVIKMGNILVPLHGITKGRHTKPNHASKKQMINNGELCTVTVRCEVRRVPVASLSVIGHAQRLHPTHHDTCVYHA